MTDKLFATIWADACASADVDAFASDWSLSSALLPDGEDIDAELVAQLRVMWHVAHDPFKELLRAMGLTQARCVTRFCIPLRTVQDWAGARSKCAPYIRLMMAEAMGLLTVRGYAQTSG